jgi:hypothetical protein
LRKIVIALGLILLISGAIIFSLSQEKTPKTPILTTLKDQVYTQPYPSNPSFMINLTKGQNFTANPPTLGQPPTSYAGIQVFVDIVDPNNLHIVNSTTDFWSYTGQAGGNWRAQLNPLARVCAPDSNIEANVTGTYTFTYSTDPPNSFIHLTLTSRAVENEKYPNSYLYYPSIVLMAGGGILTAIGLLANRKHRTHRTQALKR